MVNYNFKLPISAFVLAVCVVFSGCGGGPKVATVTGVITMDGEPIANANISFHPETGRGSTGQTDSEGRYELLFTQGRKGAVLGNHKVTISTKVYAQESRDVDYDGNESGNAVKGRAESMPDKYRVKSATILTAEVKSGKNEIDFPLSSDSE